MAAGVIGEARRVAGTDALRGLATPRVAAVVIGAVRLAVAAVLIGMALAGLATTGALLAGPIPEVGPQPGF